MPTKARYLADLLNASGELDSTGAIEAIQDQISSLFAAGSHTGISFSYDDSSGTFSATVGAEFIQDTVGAMFSSNSETNITAVGGNPTASRLTLISPKTRSSFDS